MDVEDEGGSNSFQPETLVQGLRCPVCLEYFTQPHTLGCGHSFCLKCLRTLAKVTRSSRVRPPLDRLRMRCPSCRKMTPARPILRRRASVNYALKELVSEWFNSPYATGSVDFVTLRSIACQTDVETSPTNKSSLNLKTTDVNENKGEDEDDDGEDDDISKSELRRVLFHKIQTKPELLKDIEDVTSDSTDYSVTLTADESGVSDNVTSSSEEDSEPEIVQLFEDPHVNNEELAPQGRRGLGIYEIFSISVWRVVFTELRVLWRGIVGSRSRLALTMFWFLYGGLVICVSRGFFPWMALYTVIYFVILYADISNPPNF